MTGAELFLLELLEGARVLCLFLADLMKTFQTARRKTKKFRDNDNKQGLLLAQVLALAVLPKKKPKKGGRMANKDANPLKYLAMIAEQKKGGGGLDVGWREKRRSFEGPPLPPLVNHLK